jgi:16S rRNA processing protein RimM
MTPETASPVLVARIIKPHGLLGEVVLESWTDVEGRLEETPAFLLMDNKRIIREVRVESRRMIMGRHVIKFVDVNTRNDAEALRNLMLGIPEDQIGELPPGQFFIFQLIGVEVLLHNGQVVGKVKDVVHTGGGDLLELESGELIPFNDEIVPEVDLGKKRIVINPPEGLIGSTLNVERTTLNAER